jgi:hypothetical protein
MTGCVLMGVIEADAVGRKNGLRLSQPAYRAMVQLRGLIPRYGIAFTHGDWLRSDSPQDQGEGERKASRQP